MFSWRLKNLHKYNATVTINLNLSLKSLTNNKLKGSKN